MYWETPIQEGDWFSLEYIHSVEKSLVKEKYKINENNQIIAMESWTKSFGAGLPTYSDDMELIDGFFVMRNEHQVDFLNIKPSRLHDHFFYFGEEAIELSSDELNREYIRLHVVKK
ncbi:DUF1850 domain-containing protein [Bacillus alkalicellulosilyticus]|uniref:DUF1850 domain-containing protein n=1 Tax=Alkalihalobacterium alkalicellulosilyticum TaxID=1912214 RepID=UPI001BB053A7|nr:DUF1850 domain-containing protein [Bacillus alkalicellulosilyticus]